MYIIVTVFKLILKLIKLKIVNFCGHKNTFSPLCYIKYFLYIYLIFDM